MFNVKTGTLDAALWAGSGGLGAPPPPVVAEHVAGWEKRGRPALVADLQAAFDGRIENADPLRPSFADSNVAACQAYFSFESTSLLKAIPIHL